MGKGGADFQKTFYFPFSLAKVALRIHREQIYNGKMFLFIDSQKYHSGITGGPAEMDK